MSNIKQAVTSNLGIIGTLSPYSYQVKPKTNRDPIKVVFNNESYAGRLTSGAGRGQVAKFYAYFVVGTFQHWIELTAEAHAELKKNPAATLNLFSVVAGNGPAPAAKPADEAKPAKPAKAPRKAKREAVEA